MALIEKLLPASYKGVSFLVTSSSITGGQKTVKHVFPNSDNQVIEDLGKSQRTYSVKALVQFETDDQYIQNRDRLLQVFEQGGIGKLVHPLYGDIENIKVTTFTLAENLNRLGEAVIDVVFERSVGTGTPVKAENTISEIEQLTSDVKTELSVNFENIFSVQYAGSFTGTIAKLNDVVKAFNNNTSFFQSTADEIDAFSHELNQFQASIVELMSSPSELYTSVQSLFNTMGNLYPSTVTAVDSLKKFFSFGDDDIEKEANTAQRIEYIKTLNIVNDTIQALALVDAYFNAAQIDYATVNDVENMVSNLDEQYLKLYGSAVLESSLKDTMTDVRTRMQEFFDQQKLTTQQIVTINTLKTSASLLAYQYYGSSEKALDIMKLNDIIDPTSIEGETDILTQ